MAPAPADDAAVVEAAKRLGSQYLASAELGVRPETIRRSLRKAGLLTPSKRTSRSAERLGGLALYDAGADGGRFDSVDMQAQLEIFASILAALVLWGIHGNLMLV